MQGLGQWQATQHVVLNIAAAARKTHTFTVDSSIHGVMSIRFAKYADASNVIEAMHLTRVRLTIENEQVFNGDFVNILTCCKPISAVTESCAWELMLARPMSVSKDYNLKIEVENVDAATHDIQCVLFGLVAE